jgi:galactonate dehydratase
MDQKKKKDTADLQRRLLLKNTAAATIGLSALSAVSGPEAHAEEIIQPREPIPEIVQQSSRPTVRESVKITKLETIMVKPRWLFLKVHTNAGVVGLGEPIVEGRALTSAAAIKEIEPYLVGKDPRAVVHHWQAIYRHAFYRGGPVLTSALSGVDQALWDIKGKLLGVPVYELLGGPTRQRIRVYAHARTPDQIRERKAQGFTAFKTAPALLNGRYARAVENKAWIENAVAQFAALREIVGKDGDISIDFHGAVPPATAKILMKELEQFQPFFYEEIINCQNVDLMAELAKTTHIPIATGERDFTKMGLPADSRERRGDDPAARSLPRRRHHRGAIDRGHGRGLLRFERAAQSARPDLVGCRVADRRFDPELPVPGAGEPGRWLHQESVQGARRLCRPAHGAGTGNRAG